jgi:hypothetical protein
MTDLTLRRCSNCAKWWISNPIKDEKDPIAPLRALCFLHNKVKGGGDRCGSWALRAPQPVHEDHCY